MSSGQVSDEDYNSVHDVDSGLNKVRPRPYKMSLKNGEANSQLQQRQLLIDVRNENICVYRMNC